MDHVAWTHRILQRGRIVGMAGILHRVQVIEIPEELIEAMYRGQELVQVAQVVLAELARGIAHRLKHGGDGRRFVGHADRGASLADSGQPGADRQLAGDEVRATRRATRLGVIVGEPHAFAASRSRFGVRPAMMPWL